MTIEERLSESYSSEISDVLSWVKLEYLKKYANIFDQVRHMSEKMSKSSIAITDGDLEWILTDLPMGLFMISEELSQDRLQLEVVKLKKKQIKSDITKQAEQLVADHVLSKSEIKNYVDIELVEHDIVSTAISSLVSRVETEISFSKELIMGAKKIWDARRRTESVNPVSEVNPDDIPNYSRSTNNPNSLPGTYVSG